MRSILRSKNATKTLYNFTPAVLILFLLASFSAAAQELPAIFEDPYYCAADAFNDAGGANKMNCTSGDIVIADVSLVTVEGNPDFCEEGVDSLNITQFDYTLQQQANANRYDVITWFSKFGNNPLLPTGTDGACIASSFDSQLDTNSGAIDFMGDFDGDLCTDMSYTPEPQALSSSGSLGVICNDSDGDTFADIPILISWGVQAGELNCGNTTPVLQPGNKSKCSVNVINTGVTVIRNPNMTIEKTITDVDPAGNGILDAVGDEISYLVEITNTGEAILTGVNAGDNVASDFTCDQAIPGATLALNQVLSCTGSYTVTQEDLDAGLPIENQAFAVSNQTPVPINDTTSQPIVQNPAMTVVKSVTDVDGAGPAGSVDAAGDVIAYSVLVTNSGNITETNVTLADPLLELFDPATDCTPAAPAVLAPAGSMTCTGSYTAKQTDIDGGGPINNTATASSDDAPDAQDSASVSVSQTAAMTVVKSVTDVDGAGPAGSVDAAGDVIAYSVLVTNSGNITLNNVTLADPLFAAAPVCTPVTPAILAPAASMTCTGSYAATQADIDGGGSINNTATASSDDASDVSDSASVSVVTAPGITMVKTSGTILITTVGQVVDYSFVITNTGSVTATGVTLVDANLDAPATCNPVQGTDLAPAGVMNCTGTHIVTSADLLLATLVNTATAESGTTPSSTDSFTIPVDPEEPPVVEPTIAVPVNSAVTLALLILMLLATGWYFRPEITRKF